MGYLRGFNEYLKKYYNHDLFQKYKMGKEILTFHIAGHQKLVRKIKKNLVFDLDLIDDNGEVQRIPKLNVKYFYPAQFDEKIRPLIDINSEIASQQLAHVKSPHHRRHVKNKTLYPLMMEREAVVITTYEGDVIRGFVDDFTRYEIIVKFRDDLHLIVMRHAIHLFQTFKGRDLLKTFQETAKDWQKSSLWVEDEEMES